MRTRLSGKLQASIKLGRECLDLVIMSIKELVLKFALDIKLRVEQGKQYVQYVSIVASGYLDTHHIIGPTSYLACSCLMRLLDSWIDICFDACFSVSGWRALRKKGTDAGSGCAEEEGARHDRVPTPQ